YVAPQLQGLPEHRMVRAEPAPPKLPAQHRDMRGASHTVLVNAEKAPQLRADSEQRKERRRDQPAGDALCLRAQPQTEATGPVGSNSREAPSVVSKVLVTRVRPERHRIRAV